MPEREREPWKTLRTKPHGDKYMMSKNLLVSVAETKYTEYQYWMMSEEEAYLLIQIQLSL